MAEIKQSKAERSRRSTIAICVAVSLVFWLIIKLSATYTKLEPILIDYSLPEGIAFAQQPPTMLEASVRATGWELLAQSFKTRDRRIVIDSLDLRANPDGIISIRRAVAKAFSEAGLLVDAMTNERVVLKTERVALKRVPLVLRSDIGYIPGFQSTHLPKLVPDSVTLSGPGSLLDSIAFWPTDTLHIAGVQDTVSSVALTEKPTHSAIRVSPMQVDVTIQSQQFTEKRIYVPVRVNGLGARDSLTLFPRQALLSFPVGLKDYDLVTEEDFEVVVDVDELEMETKTSLPVRIIRKPDNVNRISVNPRLVEVFLKRG